MSVFTLIYLYGTKYIYDDSTMDFDKGKEVTSGDLPSQKRKPLSWTKVYLWRIYTIFP